MISRIFRRPNVAGFVVFASVAIMGGVLAAVGLTPSASSDPQPVSACNLYPIAIPASALAGRSPGDSIIQLPRGAGNGQFSWLTWTSDPAAVTLARSLIAPGDSYLYTEPGDPTDHHVDAGDWVEGAPGAMNSALIRTKMTELSGTDIVVPVYDTTRGRGNRFDYRVARFATIRLRGFNLTGQGWLTFDFVGYRGCSANTAPQANAQSLETSEDTSLAVRLSGTDAENSPLSYEVIAQPQHGSLTGQAPALTYTPTRDYNGPDQFAFRVYDGELYSTTATVGIDVKPVNDPPAFTSTPPATATEGIRYIYQALATDVDIGDRLTYSLAVAPAGMTVDPATGEIVWTPTSTQAGSHPVTVVATDSAGARIEQTFAIAVTPINHAPRIVSTPVLTGADGQRYAYTVAAVDSDAGDTLSYRLDAAPAGMTIDAATGAIVWTPSVAQIGTHSVAVRVSDRAGAFDVQSYMIVIVRSNRPPAIVSTPVVEGMAGVSYAYQVVANDPDAGDTVTFALEQAPAAMTIDPQSGLIQWQPGLADVGSASVTVRATDHAGASDAQTFAIAILRGNHAPSITSTPLLSFVEGGGYRYLVVASDPDQGDVPAFSLIRGPQGMSIDAVSGILGWSGEGWIGNNRLPNAMCRAGSGMRGGAALAADLVAIVDESGSMDDGQAWVAELAAPLEAHMLSNDIGTHGTPNRFGLIGYAGSSREVLLAGAKMGNYRDFVDAANTLDATWDSTEEGWGAIHHAATQYPMRDGVDHNLLLVTDEDRDVMLTALTYDGMLAELLAKKIALHAVIPVRFACGDGTPALGMNSDGTGLKVDGRGGYAICPGATATEGDRTAIPDYLNLAMASGGTAWDMAMLRRGGITAQSFTNALIHLIARRVTERAPENALPDAYVHDIRAFAGNVNVEVGNRGLAPLPAGGRIEVYADDRLLGSSPLQTLAPGATQIANAAWPVSVAGSTTDPARLSAKIVLPADVAECSVENDTLDAAWVRVRATDTGGLFDEQAFAVTAIDRNDPPAIAPIPDATVSVGRRYSQTVVVTDPDRGDAQRFAILGAPLGMRIDALTGRIDWIPDAQQIGSYVMQVTATDLAGASASRSVRVTVDAALPPPHFDSTPERRAIQGTAYRYQASAVAESSAQLRFDVVVGPAGIAVDPVSGLVRWSVPADYAGHFDPVVLRVSDQYGNYDLQVYTLLGDLPNQPPSVSSTPPLQATIGNNYGYRATAQDVNVLESFHWRFDHAPAGATIEPVGGGVSWLSNVISSTHPAAMSEINPYCLIQADGMPSFASQRIWNAPDVSFPTQVLVGPLLDTDLDGQLTASDLTVAVTISWRDAQSSVARIHAFDVRDGRKLWSYGQRMPDTQVSPAMADLDGNGEATVLFVDNQRYLVALRPDGTLRWTSAAPVATTALSQAAVAISDLDGDGHAEILVGPSVYSSRGLLKWQFAATNMNHAGAPVAMDLDGDGRREVAYRGEIRDANGTLRARTQSMRDTTLYNAFYSPIRIGGQPGRHIAVSEATSSGNRLSVIDAKGNPLWVKNDLPAYGPVLVADFDGDGNDDIYVPSLNSLYSAQGDLRWTTPSGNGAPANFRAATVTDLDRDGELDILVYNSNSSALNLIAGRTGSVIGSLRGMSMTSDTLAPTIVDVAGKGNAMLFVGHASGLAAFRSANTPWHSLAHVWHQAPFALDQIRDNLQLLPADSSRASASIAVVGVRQPVSVPTRYLPDLRVSAPYGLEKNGGFEIAVDVNNRGTGSSAPTEVVLYRGSGGGTEIGRMPVPALVPGQSLTVKLQTTRAALGDEEVTALAIPAAGMQECESGNNIASGRVMQITVSDYGALEGSQSWLVAVNARAAAPVFPSIAPTTVVEGQTYRYRPAVSSSNIGDAVSFSLANPPEGARVDDRTGEVTWTPRWGQTGTFMFYMNAMSLNGAITSQGWYVTVTPSTTINRLPSITSTPVTAASVNQVYRYDVRATDPDGQAIVYSLATAPAGMSIDAISGIVLWQPASAPTAPVDVKVVATDERGGRAEQAFQIRVYATPNHAPVIVSTPSLTLAPGEAWSYTVHATDADGDPLTVLWNRVPAGATFADATANWTPASTQTGEHAFDLEVRDPRGGVTHQSFTVFVNDPARNAPPRIVSTPNPRAAVASAYASPVQAIDDDGDALTYALTAHPKGMSIDATTGVVAWTPSADQIGDQFVGVQVSDGRGGAIWQTWTVRVGEIGSGVNRAPRIASVAPATAKVGLAYRYDIAATDPDGDLLAYSLIDAPSGMRIDAQSGRIDWTPPALGAYAVRVRVSDGLLWSEQNWTLNVVDGALSARIDPATALLAPGEQHSIRILIDNAASQAQIALTLDGTLVPVEPDRTATVSTTTLGRHALVAVVSDGNDIARAEAEFYVLDGNSSEGPVVALTTPAEGATITAPTAVIGSVADSDLAGWKLSVAEVGGGPGREIASGTANVSGTLGTFDPTLLQNGQYALMLQAWDNAGHQTKTTNTVVVEGDMKLGHFSMTFEDVSVPVMGIPITITRTYDSRRSGRSLGNPPTISRRLSKRWLGL